MNLQLFFKPMLLFILILLGGCSSPNQEYIVYVGTYTGHGSDGIYAYRFNPAEHDLVPIGLVAKTENPSFMTIDPEGNFLYAVNETDSFQHVSSGAISVYTIHRESGKLDFLQQIPSLGAGPAHVSLDTSSRYLLVANYGGGNFAVFPIGSDGTLGPHSAFIQDVGSGPVPGRQAGPHAHYIGVTRDNRFAMVADLGTDQVVVCRFDENTGSLASPDSLSVHLTPGSGPRHIAFAPNGRFVYVLNELTSTVTSFSFDSESGKMQAMETLSVLPKNFSGSSTGGEIQMAANGEHLYVSNRGDDSIGVFDINSDGTLNPQQWIPTGGKTPRHFEIDPTGHWLFVANQKSNHIKLFQVDQKNGALTPTDQSVDVTSPVCIRLVSIQ